MKKLGLIQEIKTKRFVNWFMNLVKDVDPEFEDWDEFWNDYGNFILNSKSSKNARTKREICNLFCSKDLVMLHYQTWTLERGLKRLGLISQEA